VPIEPPRRSGERRKALHGYDVSRLEGLPPHVEPEILSSAKFVWEWTGPKVPI